MSRCHGSKISGSQHNRVPANMVGKNKKKKEVTKQDAKHEIIDQNLVKISKRVLIVFLKLD